MALVTGVMVTSVVANWLCNYASISDGTRGVVECWRAWGGVEEHGVG